MRHYATLGLLLGLWFFTVVIRTAHTDRWSISWWFGVIGSAILMFGAGYMHGRWDHGKEKKGDANEEGRR